MARAADDYPIIPQENAGADCCGCLVPEDLRPDAVATATCRVSNATNVSNEARNFNGALQDY
jgi:hypothetical protein